MRQSRLQSNELGMSLTEVMLVVFIIGLVSTLAIMTLPGRSPPERAAANAFATAVQDAQDEAILSGQPIGMFVDEDGYRFVRWQRQTWFDRPGGASLDSSILFLREGNVFETPNENWPDIILDPTGVTEQAEFSMRGREEKLYLTMRTSGEVAIEAR